MNRTEIIFSLKKYFKIHELVGKWTYKIHGERAWKFFSTEALYMLLIIRENLGKPITINNWFWGGKFSQRGLRTNLQNIFKQMFSSGKLYLSGHVLGEAFDFDVEGMTAPEVRNWIKQNQHLFPFKIRLERNKNGKPINWTHADALQEDHNPKVYEFDV
ncbi:hypothetical protein [Polaribacter aestuariivivens]|uniref:hypothetical protein n=1 Tax=Polaribacter aestuariivivens TaxID=2304626 RepID=UPI003F49535C